MDADAKSILMDVSELAQPSVYTKKDGTTHNVQVREEKYEFDLNHPMKIRSVGLNDVADKTTLYFTASFKPLVGEKLMFNGSSWTIVPPVIKEVGIWIINVVKSSRKNGARKV